MPSRPRLAVLAAAAAALAACATPPPTDTAVEATIAPNGCQYDVTTRGGPIMPRPKVELVHLGSFSGYDANWQVNGVSMWTQLDGVWSTTASDPRLYQPAFEYTGWNGRVGPGSWGGSIFHPYGSGTASINLDSAGVASILEQDIAAGRLPAPGLNTLYVVVTGPYVYEWKNIENGWGGYHDVAYLSDGTPIVYAVVSGMRAEQTSAPFTRLNNLIGHELREAITNPLRTQSWQDWGIDEGEIADLCAGTTSEKIDLAPMYTTWSQTSCACVAATYLTDGGFEWQPAGGTPGWPWVTEGKSSFWIDGDANDAWEGHRSLVMTGTTDWAGIAQHVPVKPNTKYVLTADVTTSANLNDLYFGVRASNGVTRGAVIKEAKLGPLTDPFHAGQSLAFDSGANHFVYVYAGFYPVGGSSWAQVDAFKLVEQTSGVVIAP